MFVVSVSNEEEFAEQKLYVVDQSGVDKRDPGRRRGREGGKKEGRGRREGGKEGGKQNFNTKLYTSASWKP